MGNKCNGGHRPDEDEEREPMRPRYQRAAPMAKMGSPLAQTDDHLYDEEKAAFHRPHQCTDIFCCLLFFATILWVARVFWYAHGKADIRRITHGLDWSGQLCGVDKEVLEYKYLYWCAKPADPLSSTELKDKGFQAIGGTTQGLYSILSATDSLDTKHPICVHSCPTADTTKNSCYQGETSVPGNKSIDGTYTEHITYHFKFVQDYSSYELAQRYCIPSNATGMAQLEGTLSWGMEAVMFRFAQIEEGGWYPVAGSAALSVILGYAYLLFAKKCAGPILKLTIFLAILMPILAGCYLLYGTFTSEVDGIWEKHMNTKIPEHVHDLYVPTTGNRQLDIAISLVLIAVGFVISCVACCMAGKLELVLGTIEATIDCMWDTPAMLIQPIFLVTGRVLYLCCAFCGFAYLLTMGQVKHAMLSRYMPTGIARKFDLDDTEYLYVGFYVVAAIWGYEFIRALDEFVFGYATQRWYFAEYNMLGSKKVGLCVFCRAYTIALVYHIGTLAFGAFLLALFRVAEIVLGFLHNRLQDAAGDDPKKQAAVKCCTAGCCCCLECWEKLVRFLNKNAYLVTAVESVNFCEASQIAFNIVMTEIAEVAVLQGATYIFQLGGLISITSAGCYLTWFACLNLEQLNDPKSEYFVSNPESVTVVAGFLSFTIALVFTFIFDVVSDAILFCYSLDRTMRQEQHLPPNDNLPPRLQKLLDHNWTAESASKYKQRHAREDTESTDA